MDEYVFQSSARRLFNGSFKYARDLLLLGSGDAWKDRQGNHLFCCSFRIRKVTPSVVPISEGLGQMDRNRVVDRCADSGSLERFQNS